MECVSRAARAAAAAGVFCLGANVAAFAFFAVCHRLAVANGLQLMNVVYDVPMWISVISLLVVAPLCVAAALGGKPQDWRLFVLTSLFATVLALVCGACALARGEVPAEQVLEDGTIEVTTPVWLDKDRAAPADPVGPLFRKWRLSD